MALSACTDTQRCREKLLNPDGTGTKSDMHYCCCIFRSRGATGAFLCRSKSGQKWRTNRQYASLFIAHWEWAKQEQTPVHLCLTTFLHRQHESELVLVSFFHLQVPNPLWDFNYPALVSNALHSCCEFGTSFPFSCSFVSLKLPVASKANKSIFSLSC